MVPACSVKVSRVSTYSGYCWRFLRFRLRGSHPLWLAVPKPFHYLAKSRVAVRTPACSHAGLGSSAFARRYWRNHCCFLFLRLLRCFSSPGSPHVPMCSVHDDCGFHSRVSPFRYLRITGRLHLPGAFRSLSRLSSAPSAKASTLRSFLHNQLPLGTGRTAR